MFQFNEEKFQKILVAAFLEAHKIIQESKTQAEVSKTLRQAGIHPEDTEEKAEEPKKRGRKAKVVEPEETVEETEEEDVAEEEEKVDMSYEDMMTEIRKIIAASEVDDAAGVAKRTCAEKFKCEKFKDLKPTQFADAIAAVKKALK